MPPLLVKIPSNLVLSRTEEKETNKKPNKLKLQKPFICSSVFFFLKDFVDFVEYNNINEITNYSPDTIILDISFFEYLENDFLNNYHRIVYDIKNNLNVKIVTICDKPVEGVENLFIWNKNWNLKEMLNHFKKDLKINTTKKIKENKEYCVIQDLNTYDSLKEKYNELKQNYFYFVNCSNLNFKNLKDINYKITIDFNEFLNLNVLEINKTCCHKIICKIYLTSKNKMLLIENLKKIKEIKENLSVIFKIVPEIENYELFTFINFLENNKINYKITQNQNLKDNQNIIIALFEKYNTAEEINCLKERLSKEVLGYTINTTVENVIEYLFAFDRNYLDVYLDLIHLIDGYFTTEEIITHLTKLHKNHTKEEIEKETFNCINKLKQKNLIEKISENKINLETETQFHLKSVYPQRNELLLFYSGLEKGYFMINKSLNLKEIEKISKEIFYFLMFSKGIYYLREVGDKLHLLLGDCIDFSKDNYLKSTHKIYQLFKRYKLCR